MGSSDGVKTKEESSQLPSVLLCCAQHSYASRGPSPPTGLMLALAG